MEGIPAKEQPQPLRHAATVLALQARQVIIGMGLSGLTEWWPTFRHYFSVISLHTQCEYILGRSFAHFQ